ncbi:hypothetical protein C8R43DRAFT_950710 [Mycena crocata]|nr:hypothetical protein C8R43DRAFT_950710 [Mycena crocata]
MTMRGLGNVNLMVVEGERERAERCIMDKYLYLVRFTSRVIASDFFRALLTLSFCSSSELVSTSRCWLCAPSRATGNIRAHQTTSNPPNQLNLGANPQDLAHIGPVHLRTEGPSKHEEEVGGHGPPLPATLYTHPAQVLGLRLVALVSLLGDLYIELDLDGELVMLHTLPEQPRKSVELKLVDLVNFRGSQPLPHPQPLSIHSLQTLRMGGTSFVICV